MLKTYRVSRTATLHIEVDAHDEEEAQYLAFNIPDTEWTDEGGDTEVVCLDDDED